MSYLAAVLRKAAPVGTTVMIETVANGRVRLFVEISDRIDPVTHRAVNPTGINHITRRAATLLNRADDYDPETDTVAARDARPLVGYLALSLHGSTGSLFAAPAPLSHEITPNP